MMSIDLSNPGVLRNFLYSQMLENKGDFYEKTNVLIFKDVNGTEFIVPEDLREKIEAMQEPKKKLGRPKKEEKTDITE